MAIICATNKIEHGVLSLNYCVLIMKFRALFFHDTKMLIYSLDQFQKAKYNHLLKKKNGIVQKNLKKDGNKKISWVKTRKQIWGECLWTTPIKLVHVARHPHTYSIHTQLCVLIHLK